MNYPSGNKIAKFSLKSKLLLIGIFFVLFTVVIILPARPYVDVPWVGNHVAERMGKAIVSSSSISPVASAKQPRIKQNVSKAVIKAANILTPPITPVSQKCFKVFSGPEWLQDILTSSKKPTGGKNIFFLETSCYESGELQLTARQACAVESAAKANPDLEIYILFASARKSANSTLSPIIKAILTYPNVNLRNVNLWTYTMGTPVEDFMKRGLLFNSEYLPWHVSDFLRILSLWRWGGTYLDFDVVVKKNLGILQQNFAGAESLVDVANGVLNMEQNGFGHFIALAFLQNLQAHFDGTAWSNNGPGVIKRVLHSLCKTNFTSFMTRDRCHGFNVFPVNTFYAVPYGRWQDFFNPNRAEVVFSETKNSVITHVWNFLSSKEVIKVGSKAAYAVFAENYCPRVYASCGEYF